MTVDGRVDTGSGVRVAPDAAVTAGELAQTVREAVPELPFDVEPASFLVTLEALADCAEVQE